MANTLEAQIGALVESFTEDLTRLVRRAAVEAVSESLGDKPKTRRGPGRPRKTAVGRSKGKRIRRSSADVDSTANAILSAVKSGPGQGASEIASDLGLTTKDLRLPLLKLLEEKKVKTKGQRRGTKYYPGSGGATSAKRATKKRKRTTKKA